MYIEKYDINGETYVKLDELNDLMKAERKEIARTMKKRHSDGKSNAYYVSGHNAIVQLQRKVNMSEDGECYIIFTRDKDGNWEYLIDVLEWSKLPEYMQRAVAKAKTPYVTFATNEIDEATLYESRDVAEEDFRQLVDKTGDTRWHITKKWMFDTEDNRDSLLRLFYDGGKEKDERPDEKAAAIAQAENAIERTRTALDRTEKLLSKVKDGGDAKPSEMPQKPPMRTVMNKKGGKRCPARYTVWYRDDSDVTTHCMGFVRFEDGIPVFTNRPCKACWFVWRDMAERVAERCGEGFEVVDMIGQMTAEERLLRAIFREDGMDGDEEPEYHGDGTRAEDEDWDGDD